MTSEMISPALGPTELENYRSDEEVRLLDAIDNLRSLGLREQLSLPQLIVCGNQSSGKSSVLEAISGLKFPSNDTLCTRFPVEVILRRAPSPFVEVTICPSRLTDRSEEENARILEFRESMTTFDEFPELIQKAKEVMGIASVSNKFSNDVLRVKISGPGRPLLTMVDLPGLFHSREAAHGGESRGLVRQMIKDYMMNPGSIILAVVSARDDIANQEVPTMARSYDPEGKRTLGIITKPDTLPAGSESERDYFSLAHNQNVELKLGWHVLRNRDYETRNDSSDQRNRKEATFFSRGIWAGANRDLVGISTLMPRLGNVLLDKIKEELPKIVEELIEKSTECKSEKARLGNARDTLAQQVEYLTRASASFESIAKSALDASYHGDFFEDSTSDAGFEKRLRAVIQKANKEFANDMRKKGHRYTIINDMSFNSPSRPQPGADNCITRSEFLKRVVEMLERSRGRELPGMFNPIIVNDLFKQQSTGWHNLIVEHIMFVQTATSNFLQLAMENIVPDTVSESLWGLVFAPFMEERRKELLDIARRLMNSSNNLHPITFDNSFSSAIQKKRMARYRDLVMKACGFPKSERNSDLSAPRNIRPDMLVRALASSHHIDNDTFAAEEALDYMESYYEIALNRIIDNVAVEIIEEGLLQKVCTVFNPVSIAGMDPDTISRIAAESSRTRAHRRELTARLESLEDAIRICGPYRRRISIEPVDEDQREEPNGNGYQSQNEDQNGDVISEEERYEEESDNEDSERD